MDANLENVILSLLMDTTNEGQEKGFSDIKALFKDPAINISLCNCVTNSTNPQVRRYAALLLRRRLLKLKHWKKVSPEVKQGLKRNILEAYLKDTDKVSRNAIAELIGAIAKHELSTGNWPELMELLNQSIRSNNVMDREVGLYSLSVITKAVGQKLKPHYKGLLSLFQTTLSDHASIEIPYYTIKALTYMVIHIGTEEMTIFQALLPQIMMTVRLLATIDQEKASECMEIFDELVESEVPIIAPHIKSLIEFCLEIAATEKYDSELRIKAVNIVAYLVRLKKKTIMKHKLTQPILETLFPLMCRPDAGDKDEDLDEEDLELSIPSAAGQAIDVMALHLPPAKFVPLLMHHLEPALGSQNSQHRKAAYLAISVIAEGCSEYIRYKHLQSFVEVLCRGVKDPDSIVCNAALYAVGQFSEYLQPDISKYASELLLVLFEYLQHLCLLLQQGQKNPPSLMRTFYALERFCENLEDIQPYLPTLMVCLNAFLKIETEKSTTVKELVVEAIGSVASAAKEHFVPYFPDTVEKLKQFISEKQTEETRPLQIQSIETLSIIARSVGTEVFAPIAHECTKYGMHLMQENDDPDIRRACYSLFSSICTVLKDEMAPYLAVIVERMLLTLKSTEGFSAIGEATTGFTLFEDGEEEESKENGDMGEDDSFKLEDEEEEDEEDIAAYSVENAYMEEKEGACLSLKEISEIMGLSFIPYLKDCFEEVHKLFDSSSDDVRRSAISTLGQFLITLHQAHLDTGNPEFLAGVKSYVYILFPELLMFAKKDGEHTVVIACIEVLQVAVNKLKELALSDGNLEAMCGLIKDAFTNKLACQGEGGDSDSDEEEQEGEYDNMVIEYAGELIACINKVTSWEVFGPYLAGLMPFLFLRTKKSCTISERSFGIGALAEIVSSMKPGTIQPFISHLQPVFLAGMKDENEEVRSNAVYGLGVLVECAGELVFDQYFTYFEALSNMISTEEDLRAKDNVCGAVARLIQANVNLVPLNEVFPVLLNTLPLKKDLEETDTVFRCLAYLHSIRSEVFCKNLPEIVRLASVSLLCQNLSDEAITTISNLIKSISAAYPTDFETIVKSLPQVNVEALFRHVNSS